MRWPIQESRFKVSKSKGKVAKIPPRRANHFAQYLAIFIVLVQLIAIIFAGYLAPYSPVQANPIESLQPPSWDHPFGTDVAGMDIFSRVIYATRIDLLIAVSSTIAAFLIGVPLGLIIGYYNNAISNLAMRVLDFVQSFPVFILAMALVAVTGQKIENVAFVLTILFFPIFARLTRAEVLSIRGKQFIMAARLAGVRSGTIMYRHILPNAVTPSIVQLSVTVGMAILITAGLSFIGAGVRMPTPEWGLMVNTGSQQMITGQWWIALFPGLAIVVSVLGFALLGDLLSNLLNPDRRVMSPRDPKQVLLPSTAATAERE
jgi:peptide/nickel transport system permease protein